MSAAALVMAPKGMASGAKMAELARHEPVMVEEVLQALDLRPGMTVVDGTVGLGGHARRLLDAISPGGTLVGLDWDEGMLAVARERLGDPSDSAVHLVHADFRQVASVLESFGQLRPNGVLLDLGLNSAQVDDPSRGLSFNHVGPLDMRMDRSSGEPAAAILNRMTPGQIERALADYGDERWARAIAKKIVERRRAEPLRTTADLIACVLEAIPPGAREKRIHPATRTFQAVRILVNRELDGLDAALEDAAGALVPGGVLAVLSYHSGEDRIVKNVFRALAASGYQEAHRKPLSPREQEVRDNPRSRSAKLRALTRLADG